MPYFVSVHDDYENAAVKLVAVGKETNGWFEEEKDSRRILPLSDAEAVRELMDEYATFGLGCSYPNRASFWAPVREMYELLNPGSSYFGFVSINASILDQSLNGRWDTPSPEILKTICDTRLLPDQILILNPDVVIFYTGPTYDNFLKDSYDGLRLSGDSYFAVLAASGLPAKTFRTYHPRYLTFRGKRREVHERIRAAIAQGPSAADQDRRTS